jgi:RHS repeat-associated protein
MDKVAQVQQTMDFDPWGARRNTNWAAMSSTELTNTFFKNHSISNSVGTDSITSRGFTGHEMLDEVGVIHMNGRIYDAKLGRFLQADPFIDAPYDTQALNRYSYVRNNPLNAVDPSGYFITILVGLMVAIAKVELIVAVIAVGITAFLEALVMGADLGDALLAGISAGALTFAGITLFPGSGAEIGKLISFGLKMGVIGGITTAIQGGKFGHGFFAAGFGSFVGAKVGGFVKGAGNVLKNLGKFMAKVTVGGTISKVTGGKFANGAGYAAFSAAASYASMPTDSKSHKDHSTDDPDDASHNFDVEDMGWDLETENGVLKGEVTYSCANSVSQCHDAAKQVLSVNENEKIDITLKWADRNGDITIEHVDSINTDSQGRVTAANFKRGRRSWFGFGKPVGSKITVVNGYTNSPGVILHEFGHALGAPHQFNTTKSVMSYARDSRTNFSSQEVQRILGAYE